MNTGVRITAFAVALAASFGTAYALGAGMDPVTSPAAQSDDHAGHGPGASTEKEGGADEPAGGLQVSEGGYTLDLKTPRIEATKDREPARLRFAVVRDSNGRNVTAYKREHGKKLHFIVASRDLTVYRHLHPRLDSDGTWSTPADLPKAGGYRVFADFTPEGAEKGLTLGSDLAVSGSYEPAELPTASATAAVDGYEVTLRGRLRPGAAGQLTLRVAKNGKAVRDLQPYLGAYGHLVALRSGDLAYLHVHPNDEAGDANTRPGPEVSFTTTAPSKGLYRLFLDFQHEGKVRTAAFTVRADGELTGGEPAEGGSSGDGHEGH
jgi:hypothetical protein